MQCVVEKNGIDQIEGEIFGYHERDYGKFDCNLSWHKVTLLAAITFVSDDVDDDIGYDIRYSPSRAVL